MKKTILAASVFAMFSGAAFGSSTMTVKWEHKLLEGRTDRPKFEFGHRMDNGFKFGFEQVWQYDRSEDKYESGFAPEQYELTFKTDYRFRWGDKNEHQAGPVLDYQLKDTAKNVRVGAFYGYRFTRNFDAKVRARYAQNIDRIRLDSYDSNGNFKPGSDRDDFNKEMRYDLWLTYKWNDWTFVWDAIVLQKISSFENNSGVEQHIYDNNERLAMENEFSAEYRLPKARAHAFYGKFKLKQKLSKPSHETSDSQPYDWAGKRDNAIEFGYKYRF
ncbi:hypothetical protein BCU70_04025 [Vibrio sp. 10N.286.49.C2]|uniref:hypothetical protein n=1 Tax=unclassified Vibrio TaxID=2614977 RepID=UPI000C83E340|nr:MULTISPECIES: hypothetical protein [unclassified Vibrio]PMH36762.1 hypothetical protein BCU70_04025 [Vibrio sp. 10N.286.49.C2]PMH54750.1 hypothetical protein BCU66_10640 [Vibrio sp. 10N.286.49.B1]PMH80270.1 hypothetical protein BCU58_24015 [Vibrio sp. 10N.286.48.B7]